MSRDARGECTPDRQAGMRLARVLLPFLLVFPSVISADTVVSGTISASTTWTVAESPYVVTGAITVAGPSSPVLTIEPGVEVRFNYAQGMWIGNGAPGGLNAVGTADHPVRFTSNTVSVTAGYWQGVFIESQSLASTRIANAVVEGGGYTSEGGVVVNGGAPVLQAMTCQKNQSSGLRVNGGTPTIQGCVLKDGASLGLDVHGGTVTLTDTTITGNAGAAIALYAGAVLEGLTGVTASGNLGDVGNAVRYKSDRITASETWKSFGLPYVPDGAVTVEGVSSPVLTIEPGVEVRFRYAQGMWIGNGAPGGLNAVGTADHPVLFTSNATSVTAGYWAGVFIGTQSLASTRIANAVVEGGGYTSEGGAVVKGGAPVLQAVTFQKNQSSGLRVNGGTPTIQGCVLKDGASLGLDVHGGTVTLTDTTITGNAGAAIALYAGAVLEGLTGVTASGNLGDVGNAVRYKSDRITASETWKSFGLPYVPDGAVTVEGVSSPVLTIEPGVEVRFRYAQGMWIGNGAPGGLNAVGTADHPVLFTLNATSVTAGYWAGVFIGTQSLASTRIANAVVQGGGYTSEGGVVVNGGAPVLQAVTFQKNQSSGLRVNGGTPTIQGCVLKDGQGGDALGLDVHGGTVALTDTTISGNAGAAIALYAGAVLEGLTGVTASGNLGDVGNAVRYRSGQITASETWKSFGLPYVPDGAVTVEGVSSPVLTIEPGVEVRFRYGQGMWIGNGAPGGLKAVGTADHPVLFTSNAASVTAGYWAGVFIGTQSLASTRIANAVVQGGGYTSEGGVVVKGGAPVLQAVTFQKNQGSGLRVNGGSPTIAGCEMSAGNERGAWFLSGSSPRVFTTSITGSTGVGVQNESSRASIRFNSISGNVGDGFLNVNGTLGARDNFVTSNGTPARNTDGANMTLDVRQQWWGAATPPTGFVGRVEYDPWLGAPPTPLFAVTSLERSTAAFNPDGAGARFSFETPSPANWALTLADAGGTEVRSFNGSGAAGSILWDGRGAGGGALPDGTYSYRLSATDAATSISAAPLLGRIALDRSIPLAILAAPLAGEATGTPITVTGTAAGTGFVEYVLEYGAGEFPSAMTTVDRGSVAVTDGMLGLWSSVLTDPVYALRLTVKATNGKTAVQQVTIRPAGQKVCQ